MSQPAAAGTSQTKREHFEQIQTTMRKQRPGWNHPELELPALPPRVAYLWQWFREVQNGERLKWEEIRAWSDLTGKALTSLEADLIRTLSFIQFNTLNKVPETPKP